MSRPARLTHATGCDSRGQLARRSPSPHIHPSLHKQQTWEAIGSSQRVHPNLPQGAFSRQEPPVDSRAAIEGGRRVSTRLPGAVALPGYGRCVLVVISLACLGCRPSGVSEGEEWDWELPGDVSMPWTPADNAMSPAKVALGRDLFYEPRLSLNASVSCASCHEQRYAFTTRSAVNEGATGERTSRNAQSLANVAYASYLTWGNLVLRELERQALNPLFGDNPIELGAGFVEGSDNHYDPARLLALVAEEPAYERRFEAAFPDLPAAERVTWKHAIDALSCFQRSLLSFDAPYDHFLAGETSALSAAQERGRQLFFSERLGCGQCHSGRLLSVAYPTQGESPTLEEMFRNTGLYFLAEGTAAYFDGSSSYYPSPNMGIGEFSQNPADDGKHRVPSLRNVTLTPPYMHDGSIATLEEVLAHYARGGRRITEGPFQGDGSLNPNKDPLIRGFDLSDAEKSDVVAFFDSLTDERFVSDPRFSDPHIKP